MSFWTSIVVNPDGGADGVEDEIEYDHESTGMPFQLVAPDEPVAPARYPVAASVPPTVCLGVVG
jgi:hypothetical protein